MERPAPLEYAVLGGHEPDPRCPGWYDALDLALRFDDGTVALTGLRTVGYMRARHDEDVERWGGYEPLSMTVRWEPGHFWDFNKIHWLGPDPHSCLVWSNADVLSPELGAVNWMIAVGEGRLLLGPDGRGLPSPEQLGRTLPDALRWLSIELPEVRSRPVFRTRLR